MKKIVNTMTMNCMSCLRPEVFPMHAAGEEEPLLAFYSMNLTQPRSADRGDRIALLAHGGICCRYPKTP